MLQMKFPPKLASLLVVGVLSVAGLTAVTSAYGDTGRWSHSSWSGHGGPHHGQKMCDHHGPGGPGGHHGKPGENPLAQRLSIIETEIGIRADQLDSWRDFTDALLATMKWRGAPGMMPQGDKTEPFSLAEDFADGAIDRAKSAEELKAAIAKLRTTLTPEQLDKVKDIEARLRARMSAFHGGPPHGGPDGMGPHGKGPHRMGPHGPPPGAGPADEHDDDEGEDTP
jgi:hypothetical protein